MLMNCRDHSGRLSWKHSLRACVTLAMVFLTFSVAVAQDVPGVGDAPPSPLPPPQETPRQERPQEQAPSAPPVSPRDLGPSTPPGESGRDLARLARTSATGLALPNTPIPADLELAADSTTTWKVGDVHYLLLDSDVRIAIGSYAFGADRAVVSVTPRSLPGIKAHEVAVYLDNVTEVGGYGPIRQEAPRLLVTSVITGRVRLTTDLMQRAPAESDPLVTAAQARINRYFESLAANTVPLPGQEPVFPNAVFAQREARREQITGAEEPLPPAVMRPLPPGVAPSEAPSASEPPLAEREPSPRVAEPEPQVNFNAGRVVFQRGEEDGQLLLLGKVQVMYFDPATQRQLSLTADRAVIFTDPDLALESAGGSTDAQNIRGVYLEDNVVVTDGQYTLRGPRVFYDVQQDRAVVLNAVFFTWDIERQVPIYVRAERIRQEARDQWSARNAYLTTSEFGEPHFAIGVKELTVRQDQDAEGLASYNVDAEGVTLNVAQTPVFYWPGMRGGATDVPLRALKTGHSSRLGAVVETRWDLLALLDRPKPEGVDIDLLVDGYTERGPGIGLEADYDVPNAFGEFQSYYLHDRGEDEPGGRLEVEPETENRGRLLWRHRHELADNWEATAELAWLSDPTFLEEFFREEAYAEKEYETLIYLKQQQEDWAFTFLTKYNLTDFIPQLDRLQTVGNIGQLGDPSIGYTTNKLPELAYYRVGTGVWDDRLTWYSENRASVMRLSLPEDTPRERGFNAAESVAIFGIANNTHFNDALRNAGLDEHTRFRFDTRQELAAPMKIGAINVAPYVAGRFTGYDDGFEDYHGEDENLRLWGAVGVRAGTSLTNTMNSVEWPLFDVHRLRHVIEPYVDLFYADTTIQQEDLPVYDYDIESVAEGAVFSFGIRNVLQTQRGGPGNWRSVDWVRIDSRFVFDDQETEESPIPRFFAHRPELSLFGDHLENTVAVQLTDAVAAVHEITYRFDDTEIAQWNIGLTIDHTPRFSTFLFYRDLNVLNSEIVQYGFEYLLTPKYHMAFAQSYDISENENRNTTLTLTRRLPRWLLIVALDFDDVEDITSVGVALAPEGFSGGGDIARNPFLFLH